MEFTQKQTIKAIAILLFLSVITQVIYTGLYKYAGGVPRQWLWGLEGLLFTLLAAFAGSALVKAKQYTLGFSAILTSALFNFLQVGIGLTQFGPFREAAQGVEGVAPAAGAVVAFSFFIYNGAKILLGISAIVFGTAVSNAGSQVLGKLTVFLGIVAIVLNSYLIMFGRAGFIPSHVAGATGVIATFVLAVCVFKLQSED